MTPDPSSTPAAPRSRPTLAWLVLAQIGALLTLLPWFYLAALSALDLQINDATSDRTLALFLLSYPVVPLVCSIGAWYCYYVRRFAVAAAIMPLPLIAMMAVLYWLYGGSLWG